MGSVCLTRFPLALLGLCQADAVAELDREIRSLRNAFAATQVSVWLSSITFATRKIEDILINQNQNQTQLRKQPLGMKGQPLASPPSSAAPYLFRSTWPPPTNKLITGAAGG